jgi:hypothetical protein
MMPTLTMLAAKNPHAAPTKNSNVPDQGFEVPVEREVSRFMLSDSRKEGSSVR